jgi:hypothetical protein
MKFEATAEFAYQLDSADALSALRGQFEIPQGEAGEDCIYLCGKSH